MNRNENIKPSANVIEASYFNIFECRSNVLDNLDVTYQSAFAASERPSPPAEWGTLKPSPPAAVYTSSLTTPLKKMLSVLTGSQKPSTPSPVSPLIIFFNGVVNEDAYYAAAGDGFSGPHSAGGDGFSDAVNAF